MITVQKTTVSSVDELMSLMDDVCVYPEGWSIDCVDCTQCRDEFRKKVIETLSKRGHIRLIDISIPKDG